MTGRAAACALAVLLGASGSAESKPYEPWSLRLSLGGTVTGAANNRYLVIGGAVGVFVLPGLEAELQSEYWFLGRPSIGKVSPGVRYVFHFVPHVQPYLGVLYRHAFVGNNRPDRDIVGGRAGFFFAVAGSVLVSLGAVHEVIVSDCVVDCSLSYPEMALSLSL